MKKMFFLLLAVLLISCCPLNNKKAPMDSIAEDYVKLVLEIGLYDGDVVDAYYGSKEWKPAKESKQEIFPVENLISKTDSLLKKLKDISDESFTEIEKLRYKYLNKQLIAVKTKIQMINGQKFNFNEEARLLYDADVPSFSEEYFSKLISALDKELPGKEDIAERYLKFRKQFVISEDKLDKVFDTAITEARKRTLKYIKLPENENFKVEMVKNVPWGAYNWYKGNSFSVIQVNTERDVYIDRAINLACHEGYPGHHVYSVLLEKHLYNDLGWVEYSVYPLFSPQSLIAEGTANYGILVAFPGESRVQFEKKSSFPSCRIGPGNGRKILQNS